MTANVLLALVVAPLVIAATVVLVGRPLTVTLPLFAAVLPFGGLLSVGSSRFSSLSSILGLLLVAGLLVQVVAGRRTGVPMSLTVPLWMLFLAVAGATTLWSLDAATTAVGFVVLGSLSALYILVSMSPVDRGVLRRTENGLLVGGVAVTCYGLVQLLVPGWVPRPRGRGPAGSGGRFGNDLLGPDNEAVSLLLPLVIALSRSVTRERPRSRMEHAGLAALMLLGVLMTGSRGGILAADRVRAGPGASRARSGRRRLLTYTVVGLMLGAVAFFLHPLGIAERTVATSSSSGRFAIWRVGLAACPQYCPLGSGWETFPLVYAKTQPSVPDAQVLVGKGGSYQPHNVILLVAIELGHPRSHPALRGAGRHGGGRTQAPREPARSSPGRPGRHVVRGDVPVQPGVQVLLDGVDHGRPLAQRRGRWRSRTRGRCRGQAPARVGDADDLAGAAEASRTSSGRCSGRSPPAARPSTPGVSGRPHRSSVVTSQSCPRPSTVVSSSFTAVEPPESPRYMP